MLYNCKGDLYKIEIVKRLKNMGFDVNKVNALNKISASLSGIGTSLTDCLRGYGKDKNKE